MPRIEWDAVGQRFFETGIDQGVLYVNDLGYAWPGLISVAESPSGGDARPYYLDGVKYLNLAASEEFEATLNAFYSPPEFRPCSGVTTLYAGLMVTQQRRQQFGLSYRTKLGNDTLGPDYGYKIHIVYNALAAPASRDYNTMDASVNPSAFSWGITTVPPAMTGVKPTAHLIIDSSEAPPSALSTTEDILYGSDAALPRLPTPDELAAIFGAA